MTDLETLRGLCALLGDAEVSERLRHAGLESVRVGELELRFAPSVPPPCEPSDAEASPATERNPISTDGDDDERNALELLLHSSGADAAPLLAMQRKSRAAS